MNGSSIIFYLLATMVIVCGILSVSTRMIFRSAIFLLFTLIGIAGIYFWMDEQFVAAVQIVVYVGGIVVLIIFSIFLTQQAGTKLPRASVWKNIFAALVVIVAFLFTIYLMFAYQFIYVQDVDTSAITMTTIGNKMLSTKQGGFALPFEVVSILLLAALIGCIVIAQRLKTVNSGK